MKTSTFVGNLIFWIAAAIPCGMFTSWYYSVGAEAVQAASAESVWALVGTIAGVPALLYAIGAIIGLVVIKVGGFRVNQSLKSHAFIVASLVLALMVAAVVPVIAMGTGAGLSLPTLLISYAGVFAPLIFLVFGALYAIGIAPAK